MMILNMPRSSLFTRQCQTLNCGSPFCPFVPKHAGSPYSTAHASIVRLRTFRATTIHTRHPTAPGFVFSDGRGRAKCRTGRTLENPAPDLWTLLLEQIAREL